MSEFRTFLVSYNYEGAHDGELVATVPAVAGPFVRLFTAAQNWLAQ